MEQIQRIESPATILIADDDADDRMLIERAFGEGYPVSNIEMVADGEELLTHLRTCLATRSPLPTLILLDLNMPRKGGYEALRLIKAHPVLRYIPVIVMTTSRSDEDVRQCYQEGANAFVTKSSFFDDLIAAARSIGSFWLGTTRLPSAHAYAPSAAL